VEDSPLTRVVPTMNKMKGFTDDECASSIGMYIKSGFCYNDLKCFVPQILSMALISLWFSDKKNKTVNREAKEKRI